MGKNFYTTAEIAKLFDVYMTTVADWVDSGRLAAYRTPGGHRRVRPAELRAFLRENKMPIPAELEPTSPTILIIDDDADFSKMLARRLAAKKFQVETAESGFGGIYKIGRLRPEVVVLDIFMPGMDGVEVCEKIKSTADLKDTRVIAMTGNRDDKLRERILAKGADAFILKPREMRDLVLEILAFVDGGIAQKPAGKG